MAVSFDTPRTSTIRPVPFTGTIDPHATSYVTITLAVTNTTPGNIRNQSYEIGLAIANTSSSATHYHATYNMVITPKLYGNDTVATSISSGY